MKLIDRYMLRTFLVPLGYCLLAFSLIYIIFDLFTNLPDFLDGDTPAGRILFYYVMLLPSFMIYILPISLLLGVLASLSSLTKNSELTAMRASGLSLLRIVWSYIVIGVLASVVLLAINETIGPKASYWCYKFVSEQGKKNKDPESVHVTEVAFNKKNSHRIWYIHKFDTRDFSMKSVEVTQRRPDGSDEYKLRAESGRWLDGYWMFYNIERQDYDKDGNRKGLAKHIAYEEMYQFDEKPVDFLTEIKISGKSEHVSSREILSYIRNNQLPPERENLWMVDYHARLAMPWSCLIVILLGIPFGNQTGRKGALMGFMLSIGLFFAYYALVNFGIFLGKSGSLPPLVAGWLPHIIFLPIALYMIYRIR